MSKNYSKPKDCKNDCDDGDFLPILSGNDIDIDVLSNNKIILNDLVDIKDVVLYDFDVVDVF